MAEVTVFVDDAVRGVLPQVCAIDGVPTSDRLRLRAAVGGSTGLGALWLLVFLGPFGIAALIVIAALRSPLDGSRRWVHLRNVHPSFAEAYRYDDERQRI